MKPSHILTVACLILGGEARAAELIVNGGFEEPFVLSTAYTVFSVPGWTINRGVEICPPDAWPSQQNRQSVMLHGTNSAVYIEQAFTTSPGQTYRLTFYHANNPDSDSGSFSVRLFSSSTLVEQALTHSGSTRAAMNYTLFETNFTTDSTQTTLRFTRTSENWGQALILDAVSVTPIFCTPHRATAVPALVNGFVVGATITDGGCGYSNAPLVLIQGGSGAGATATATVNNGRVTAINITGAGIGYTTNPAPRIVIASPPFEPSVGIRFSKVEVTQHVTLGRNYVLESSPDLATWSATGQAFTAASENYTNEFIVGQTGQFFRLREVP